MNEKLIKNLQKLYNLKRGYVYELKDEFPEDFINEMVSAWFIHYGYSRTHKTWGINKIFEEYLSELELI